jgi:chorismate mutase / prephenate dehydratase
VRWTPASAPEFPKGENSGTDSLSFTAAAQHCALSMPPALWLFKAMQDPVVIHVPQLAGSSVEALKSSLDRIDDGLLNLALQRIALARAITDATPGSEDGMGLRPARDVQVLRRLIATAGPGAASAVLEIWRALTAAALSVQPTVLCAAPVDRSRLADVARQHFGGAATLRLQEDVRVALRAVAHEANTVAVLPWPGQSGGGQWWTMMREREFGDIRMIAALPLLPQGADVPPDAVVMARGVPLEPAGDDETLVLCDNSRTSSFLALQEAGFHVTEAAKARNMTLYRLRGFVSPEDNRIEQLMSRSLASLDLVRVVGTYARLNDGAG